MAQTIFFSWQSDTPNRVGRSFLKEVLEEVCKGIGSDPTVDEALRDLEVDSDTQGVAGQPPIVETIFKKIDASAVFVADMTLVGVRTDGSRIPNPNVLIEYGWALKALNHERTIWLMNTAYGEPTGENLPFDLRHARRPMGYNLPDGATAELKREEKQKLVKSLTAAIRASLATLPAPAIAPPPKFPEAVANDPPARFRKPGDSVGFENEEFAPASREVFLYPGSAMWLRLMPMTNPERRWTARELSERAMNTARPLLMPLVHTHPPGCSFLRAEDGMGLFQMTQKDLESKSRSVKTDSISFVFETGEIWSIATSLLRENGDRLPFVENYFLEAIQNYGLFLKSLEIEGPYRWVAGLVGVKGRYFNLPKYAPVGSGRRCSADLITTEGQYTFGQDPSQSLQPFFDQIFEKCGLKRQ
jgi:hypothetical protein